MNIVIALALCLSALLSAQVSTPGPTPPVTTNTGGSFQPAYYIGTGATYDYYGKTGFAANTEVGIRIGSTNVYSYSTLQLTLATSTLRTGAAYMFYQTGNWSLLALGDAGLSTSSASPALGSFSGGGIVMYDVGARVTKGLDHFYIGVGGRYVATSTLGQQPIATITFGKGF